MKETKQAASSAETRAALHEVMAAFESFKAANDERLGAIETHRPDGLLEEKVARIDAGLQRAQARMDRTLTDARRPAIGGDVSRFEPDERKSAWDGYLKTGRALGLELKSGLAEASPSTGGYIAPPETERVVERRLMQASPMREIASVVTIGAGSYKKPVSTVGVTAGWAAETAARPQTDAPTLDLLEFPAADLYASPAATQAMLDDAFVNLDDWLAAECEDAFAAQETAAFVGGDGVSKPKGFLSYPIVADASQAWGKVGYVATGVDGHFAGDTPGDTLMSLIYTPRVQFRPNARFVMNRKTVGEVRKFKDGDGRYLWAPGAQPGQPSTLMGYPVTEMEAMPDIAAGSYSVAFGDFAKGYLIVDRAGLRVLRDPYSAKPFVLFYTTKRVGGGVQNFDAIKLLKFSAS